jgi:FkbM family methyltransferase
MLLVRRFVGRLDQFARQLLARLRSLAPGLVLRRSMSRATPPRNRLHGELQRRYREHRLQRFLAPHLEQGALAFDLGANVGEWTQALRACGARVVSVEPQAACADTIRQRFAGDRGVRVLETAVGEVVGHGVLVTASSSSEHASMSAEWRRGAGGHRGKATDGWGAGVDVPVTTIDALIAQEGLPRLCKIDVEGFEADVLRGLSQPIDRIAFEFHYEMAHVVEACVARLEQLGRYRYRLNLAEWPEPTGVELAPEQVGGAVRALAPDAWGMVLARRMDR